MEFDQNRPRPMLKDVSGLGIKCAKCGTDINELPFSPTKKEDGTFGTIYCYECNKERRQNFRRER
jgi:hypothetical protein